jgi:DNA gyrase subunit B
VVDNSIDEALGGFCDTIKVIVNKDGSVSWRIMAAEFQLIFIPRRKNRLWKLLWTVLHAG